VCIKDDEKIFFFMSKFNVEPFGKGFLDGFEFAPTDKNKEDILLDSEDLVFISSTHRGKDIKVSMEPVLLSDICSSEWGYSLFLGFDNENDAEASHVIDEKAKAILPADYDYKPLFKDGAFFAKLRVKDGKFKALSNVSVEDDEFPLTADMKVSVLLRFKLWVRPQDKKASAFVDLISVKSIPMKKRKSSKPIKI